MKKNILKGKLFIKIKEYYHFYAKRLLKPVTLNYCILLLIFLGIIMISLSSYNVEAIKTISDIQNPLQNISFFKELFIVTIVVFVILISSIVPHFKLQTLIAAIYTYFISTEVHKVFRLSYSNNNLNLMVIGVVVILLGLSIICSISLKINELVTYKMRKKNKEQTVKEYDKRYDNILKLAFFIILVGVIIYNI